MKNLLYISVILAGLVAISELSYLDESSLALIVLGLAIAVALQGIYLIKKHKD